jgi:predicted methyltransferase
MPEPNMKTTIAVSILAMVLSACGQQASEPATEPAAPAAAAVSIYAAALAHPGRPAADLEDDARRQPDKVLEFFGIAAGDTVLDLFSGGGYYTEMLSHVVGTDGHVTSHTNSVVLSFSGDEFNARLADNRLANVDVLMAENNELELEAGRYDAVNMTLNYHDLYWVSTDYGWEKIDVDQFLAELYQSLKPGGILGIVDHSAEAGAPREVGGTLHRVDPGVVLEDLENAGFVLDGESDLLRSSEDDYSINVFDEAVRGKTDRFALRFRKPE